MNDIVIVLLQVLASYALFFFVSLFAWKFNCLSIDNKTTALRGINIKNITGILIFLVPLVAFNKQGLIYFSWPSSFSIYQFILFALLLVIIAKISLQAASRQLHTGNYQSPAETIPTFAVIWYLIIRIVFLISYECFFRGLLLYLCIDVFRLVPGVAANIFLYILIHLFNGKKEIIYCLPFGLLLAFTTLSFGSLIPAILLHILLAIVYETKMLVHPPSSFKIIRR